MRGEKTREEKGTEKERKHIKNTHKEGRKKEEMEERKKREIKTQ